MPRLNKVADPMPKLKEPSEEVKELLKRTKSPSSDADKLADFKQQREAMTNQPIAGGAYLS
jgi:hypothetical protein